MTRPRSAGSTSSARGSSGKGLEPARARLSCRIVEADQRCRRCGREGTVRHTGGRLLAHEPLDWQPTALPVTVRSGRCTGRRRVWHQDTTRAAPPLAKLFRRAMRWAREALVNQRLTSSGSPWPGLVEHGRRSGP